MRIFICFLLLFALGSCTSDDTEPCTTQQPVEIKQGEARISITWQDLTEDRIVSGYDYQLVFSGDQASDSFQRTTVPVTTAPENERFFIKTIGSLPYETDFDLYYRVVCGNQTGEVLGPIAVRSLSFGAGCTPPADLEVLEVTPTSISLQWEGFDEQLWAVSWGSNDGMDGGDVDVTDTSFTITDLRPGITYLLGVKARCTGTDFVTSELDLNPTQSVTTPAE